jgi:hypothetical protein
MSRFKVKSSRCSGLPGRRSTAATRRSARVPTPTTAAWAETFSKFPQDGVELSNFNTSKQNQLIYHLLAEKTIPLIKIASKEWKRNSSKNSKNEFEVTFQ